MHAWNSGIWLGSLKKTKETKEGNIKNREMENLDFEDGAAPIANVQVPYEVTSS